jgi:hypothetical protein
MPSAAADRRGCRVLDLAHEAFLGDYRLVVGLAQLSSARDPERRHEVHHVEPVGTQVRALFCLPSQMSSSDIEAGLRCRRTSGSRTPAGRRSSGRRRGGCAAGSSWISIALTIPTMAADNLLPEGRRLNRRANAPSDQAGMARPSDCTNAPLRKEDLVPTIAMTLKFLTSWRCSTRRSAGVPRPSRFTDLL